MLKQFFEILKFVLRSPQFLTTLQNPKIIFYAQNNNLSYTQHSLFFFFRKIFIFITMILALFLFFFFRKIFISVAGSFSAFFFFFFRKILVPFLCFYVKLFFAFLIIFINDFYLCKQKILKKFLIVINHFSYIKNNIFYSLQNKL